MTYLDSTYATDTTLRDAVITTLTTAGFTTTTNANPYTPAAVAYYVLKSPSASNAAGVDWFVCVWMDTTNNRVAIMPFVEFSDVATPQYRKFVPNVNSVPGGDGYSAQVLQNIGSFTGSPACIVLQRGAGTGRLVMRATTDMIVATTKSSAGLYRGGYCGSIDWNAENTERPALILAVQLDFNGSFGNSGYSGGLTAAAAIPAGRADGQAMIASDLLPQAHGSGITYMLFVVSPAGLLTRGNVTQEQFALRDAYDNTKVWAFDMLVYQYGLANLNPRIKFHGKLRDIQQVAGTQPEIGDLVTIDGVAYRAIGASATNYFKNVFVVES